MSNPYSAMISDWLEKKLKLIKQGNELVKTKSVTELTQDFLEDEEIEEIVAKIIPHLHGLNYAQASRVLCVADNTAMRLSVLGAKSIRKACEELPPASSGQA